jgi:EAL domain-containing protein (putative c-di-GMP-specific phosphodiesterase class I)
MDAQVIAEGIEEAGVATAMRHLGVGLGQGYLFGRPAYPEAAAPAAPATPQPVPARSNGNGGWSVRRR